MLQTTINNLLVKARLAMINKDFKQASEIFNTITEISYALERGETENDSHGLYLVNYAKKF